MNEIFYVTVICNRHLVASHSLVFAAPPTRDDIVQALYRAHALTRIDVDTSAALVKVTFGLFADGSIDWPEQFTDTNVVFEIAADEDGAIEIHRMPVNPAISHMKEQTSA